MCHSPPPFSMFAGRKVLADTYAALGLYILRIYLTGDRKERQCGASHGRTEAVVDVQSYTTSLMHEPSNAVSSPSQKSDRGSPVQRLVTVLALGQRHGPIVDVEIWPLCGTITRAAGRLVLRSSSTPRGPPTTSLADKTLQVRL